MSNPFKAFYNTEVQVLEITVKGVYEKVRTETELCLVCADIQPYSGGLAEAEYGYSSECQFRMFCDKTEAIKMGNYIKHEGKLYKILYVAEWELGLEVLLSEYIG